MTACFYCYLDPLSPSSKKVVRVRPPLAKLSGFVHDDTKKVSKKYQRLLEGYIKYSKLSTTQVLMARSTLLSRSKFRTH